MLFRSGDRRVTNCRRERGGSRGKSAQVEKRSGEPAQIAVRYPPRVKGYHLRSQTESRSGRLRGSNKKAEGNLCFFLPEFCLNGVFRSQTVVTKAHHGTDDVTQLQECCRSETQSRDSALVDGPSRQLAVEQTHSASDGSVAFIACHKVSSVM